MKISFYPVIFVPLWPESPYHFESDLAIPVFLVIFLIAKYPKSFQNDSTVEDKDENNKTILIFYPLVTIIFSFMGVRIIGYYILKMTSRISDLPFEIISWTFFMGLLIGIMYIMYQKIERRTLWLHRVIRFTFILFGINWIMFNIFVPLLLRESFIDFLIYRAVFDIFAVFIGVSLGELLKNKMKL
ncbi:MAG: hypothetical protein KKF30_19120 [Proteobacteria bacterium]|nr:hypothetical protein [Pseudomonadota bacterium]